MSVAVHDFYRSFIGLKYLPFQIIPVPILVSDRNSVPDSIALNYCEE